MSKKEQKLFTKPFDIFSDYYIKAITFLFYLLLIVMVSCSSAYLKNQLDYNESNINNESPFYLNKDMFNKESKDTTTDKKKTIKEELSNSIVLIIDDCGINEKNTKEIVNNSPKEVTLSYLPYARNIQEQVNEGLAKEHEIMLHLPMEAISYNEPNINTLRTEWDDKKLREQINIFLDSFEGYKTINNHTGSKFTQDHDKMTVLLNELKTRNINFLDSLTISSSIAYDTAKELNVPTAKRNLFIDHYDNEETIYKQLEKAEVIANKNGYAIIIGHPKDNTISALNLWFPTLEEKGIKLIPVSKIYQ